MISEWTQETLQDVCLTITDGAHNSPREFPNGLPMASVKDLTRHGIDLKAVKRISAEDFDKLKRQGCMPLHGDVLIAKDGNSALDTVCVYKFEEEVVLLSSIAILRPNNKVYPGFLCYYLDAPQTRKMLKEGYRSGSAIPRVVLKDFRRAPIRYPPLKEQQAIACILGALDDKIELNRKMNQTLEAMARAIFKSWFVDFDPVRAKVEGRDTGLPKHIAKLFPDSFEDSELGEIPKGWKVQTFAETLQIFGGGTPKTSVPEYWGGDIPWFSVVDAPTGSDVWVVDTEKKITHEGLESSSTRVLPVGTTIITARGTVGRIALVGVPMAMNQSCYGLQGKAGTNGSFTYFATRNLITSLKRHSHGSVFDTITRDTLDGISTVLPPNEAIQSFESIVGPSLERIRTALLESQTLAALRDALLPKLISGQLRIPNAEKIVRRCI